MTDDGTAVAAVGAGAVTGKGTAVCVIAALVVPGLCAVGMTYGLAAVGSVVGSTNQSFNRLLIVKSQIDAQLRSQWPT